MREDDMSEERNRVYDILKGYENVMLVTHGTGGRLDARPMHVARLDEGCDLWFLTRVDDKVDEVRANPDALVVAQHEEDSWLSVTGRVEVLDDRSLVDELWQEPYRAWFPDGKDDPNLRILAFRSDRGEYWDQRGTNKITYGLKVAAAYATGTTPEEDSGEHGVERL
jgi:general stress protein 26